MTRYSNYNNSETKWIGSIPDNWGISRLDREAYIRARLGWRGLKADEYVSSGYGFLATPNIKGRDIDFTNINFISAERYFESPEIILDVGDVLLTKDGSTIGTTNIVRYLPFPCTVNGSIAVLTPTNGILPLYLYYYLMSPKAQDRFWYLQDGQGVPHLFQRDLRKIEIIKPPLEEQSAIVRHLENKTAEIDGLIEKLRREVELLEQYRRELIAHTVTRGLNPDASIQDSGIDWIGDGPSDWNHFSAKSLFVRRTELERKDDIHLTPSQTYGVIPQEDFIKLSGTKPTLKLSETSKMRHVEPGDFIIHLRSFQGGLELSGFQGKVSGAYTVITPREPSMVNHSYFKWLFKSSPFIRGLASLTNQLRDGQSINFTTFSRTSYLVPPIEQQQQIAEFLDMKTSRIDSTISDINKQTALLGRYRKQVINDAVTGKIRVGKVA